MARSDQFKRVAWLGALLIAALAGLGFRLFDLQLLRHQQLSQRARQNVERTFIREPRRGEIRDARGHVLATSVAVKTICADPTLMMGRQAYVAKALAPLLQMSEAELVQKLTPSVYLDDKTGALKTNQYVRLQRKVSFEKWEQIRAVMQKADLGVDESTLTNKTERANFRNLRNAGIFADRMDDQLRVYPNGSLAAHVLGYVGLGRTETPAGAFDVTTGCAGIELQLNRLLSGVPGWLSTETDKRRNELVWARDQDVPARPGQNVVLTLDAGVQYIVEAELAEGWKKHTPLSVSAVVTRPRTGEILAMATLPNFNPNNLEKTPEDWTRNRVITDRMEPGSTFKIVVIGAAMNEGLVTLNDRVHCENGRFHFKGKILHDHESYGMLTIEDVIAKSSNIGSAKVGLQLGEKRLHDYIRGFGFGSKTSVLLPGEVPGVVVPYQKWDGLAISRIPMGHAMDCTILQMVMAMSAIANDGVLMHPMIVDRIEDENGGVLAKYTPQPVRRVISADAANQLTTALKKVVSKDGTAANAMLEHYTVAGKTGTAQKVIPGQGYVRGKYFSSFIGFFPADNPELCISVVFDEPKHGYYGGQTAAPVFQRIAERCASYLKIKPDRELEVSPLEAASAAAVAARD
jgi:cell division protein FtsI/penicillin-binding protein 2